MTSKMNINPSIYEDNRIKFNDSKYYNDFILTVQDNKIFLIDDW